MVDLGYAIERGAAGRWIAGPTTDDAIAAAKRANRHGIGVIINYLGEEFTSLHDVADAVGTYIMLMDAMVAYRVKGDISVKPTSLGLQVSRGLFESNLEELADHARKRGAFLWIDMEGHELVDATIDAYMKLAKKGNMGICIQSYLRRSMGDVERIAKAGGIVRLVKGAYSRKDGRMMLSGRDKIGENYRSIMRYLFENSQRFTIATHDRSIISDAILLNKRHKRKVTYAMLNGIDNAYLKGLAAAGESTALYLPFGTRWIGYSYRRLREVGHTRLILGSLFKSQQL